MTRPVSAIAILVAAAVVMVVACAGVGAGSATWIVDDSGGAGVDFCEIQAAVDAANQGDTIFVYSGTYYENVNVTKQLILRGVDIGCGKPVVNADGVGSAITLSADGVTLEGFNATNSSSIWLMAGINVTSNNNTIINNTASNNWQGIILCDSSSNILYGNICPNNFYGVYLLSSSNNTLTNNTVNSNIWYGIDLWYSSNNTLINNLANDITGGGGCGIRLTYSSNNVLQKNTVNNTGDRDEGYGIHLRYSINNTLTQNTCSNNHDYGIRLTYSSNNTLYGNTVSNNNIGALLFYSSNNTILANNVLNNGAGIWLYDSNENILQSNTCSNNGCGIYIEHSSNDNRLYHNNLIANIQNAYDECANQWDSGSEGNYYSDYTGTDPDGDGIGKDPYRIPGGLNKDRYPLMECTADDVNPPELTITSHTSGDAIYTATVTVAGTASDTSGIALVTVNGEVAMGTDDWSAEVALVHGENTITVVATDGVGLTTTKVVTVTYSNRAVPEEEWNVTFGATGDVHSVQQTTDGGYILAGYTISHGAGGGDFWLIKTDSDGNEQWNETFGGADHDEAYSIQQTTDGGYIIVGETSSYGADYSDFLLVKTDSSGSKQWDQVFKRTGSDYGRSVQQTTDGGYIIVGITISHSGSGVDFWLIKTDSDGNKQWDRTFGGTEWDEASSVQQTTDGGYIIAGDTDSYGEGGFDFWLVKTDSNGYKVWDRTFGGIGDDRAWAESVQQTTDGGYIIAGDTDSYGEGGFDFWLVKTDSNGNEVWNKTFGGTEFDIAYSVQQTTDGGYVLVGLTVSYGAGWSDFWIVKTDSNGNEQWNKTFGGDDRDWAESVQQTSDGGYILVGTTYSYYANFWLIKLSPEGTTSPTLEIASPAPDTTTHTPTITVAGTASDPSGIASVTVNGALASGAADWSAWSAEVALAVGENTIEAISTNNTGGSRAETINVTYEPLTDPPAVTLATTLSDSYTVGEPITIGISLDNTGTTQEDATIVVTTTSGFSDTKTVTIIAASTYSENFNIGSISGGSYTATIDLYVDSALLDSSSMPFTVRDPAAVKIADDHAETLKRTAIYEFDEMAGIPASASSSMITEFGLDKLEKYVGDHLGTATGEVQKESGGSISDSDVQLITDEADATIDDIGNEITDDVSRCLIQKIEEKTGKDLPDVNLFDLKDSVSSAVYGSIKAVFERIVTDALKDRVVKPFFTRGEENKVELRDCEFDSYVELTPFSLSTDDKTKITQRFNVGCGAISSVTESKALFTVGPYYFPLVGEVSYAVTLGEEKNKFEEIDRLGTLLKCAISALVVTGVVFTFLISVLGTGGALLLPLISAIPHIIVFLKTIIFTMVPVAKSFLIVGMLATVSVIAPDVTLQHDTTLDTIEDIIADITASDACSVSISKVSSTASYIDQSSSVTVKLNNEEPTKVQPITEVMVFSPDGRIIDIQRQDPYIASHSTTEITRKLHIPSKSGTYNVLGMVHAGGVATSIAQASMNVTKPSLEVNLSTDSRIYSLGDTIEITANFTNSEESEIGNLTYVIEVINTTTVDADVMVLAALSNQTKTLSFTTTDEGSYIAAATLLLGFTEVASETIGFTVGSGEGLVINAAAEDLYPPEADVTFEVTIENIGTVHTDSTINVTTFDELTDFYEVYTSEIPVSLDAGASTTMQPTVLPNAPPGIYRTIITAGDYSAQSVGYTVTANGTLFTLLGTDKLYYNLTDVVNITITTNDVLFNATNASVNVSVTYPNGTVTNPAVSGSGGDYIATFDPASNGTYEIAASSQKTGFRTYDDETFAIVGARSTLNANLSTNNLTFNQTVYFGCNISNEYGTLTKDAIVTLSGCGINATAISDAAGMVSFVITPNATGTIAFAAGKGGYSDYTSTIYVFGGPDSTIVGDLNGDNHITPADAVIALQLTAGGSTSCDPATLDAADVSGDGRVTSLDALMILQAAAGAIEL